MAKVRGRISIEIEKCKGCEFCIFACPQESLHLASEINAQGHHFAKQDMDNCTGCVSCALVCPEAIITVYRTDPKGKTKVAVVQAETRDIFYSFA